MISQALRASLEIVGIDDIDKALRSLEDVKRTIKELEKQRLPLPFDSRGYQEYSNAIARLRNLQKGFIDDQRKLQNSLKETAQGTELAADSYAALNARLIELRKAYKSLSEVNRNNKIGSGTLREIQALDVKLKSIDASMGQYYRNVGNYRGQLLGIFSDINPQAGNFLATIQNIASVTQGGAGLGGLSAGFLAVGTAMAAAGVAAASYSFEINRAVSDLKADVRKTTQLTKAEVDSLTEALAAKDTRTSLNNMLEIATVAGRLGVNGKENVLAFTESIEILNVALGDEFKGGTEEVTDEIGRLSNILFGATNDGKQLADNLLFLGNALNVAANSGVATADVVTDIAKRIGSVGKAFGLTNGQILGFATTIQEVGIDAERGSTAFVRILTGLAQRRADFARVLGLDLKDLTDLINQDASKALQLVIKRVAELGETTTDTSDILKQLGIDGFGELEIFTKLSLETARLEGNFTKLTKSLSEQNSVIDEQKQKTDNLAGSWERLKNNIADAFVSSNAEKFFKNMVDYTNILVSNNLSLELAIARRVFGGRRGRRNQGTLDLEGNAAFMQYRESQFETNRFGITTPRVPDQIKQLFDNLNIGTATGAVPFAPLNFSPDPTELVKTTTPKATLTAEQKAAIKAERDKTETALRQLKKQYDDSLERIEKERLESIARIAKITEQAKSEIYSTERQKELQREALKLQEDIAAVKEREFEIQNAADEAKKRIDEIENLTTAQREEKKRLIQVKADAAKLQVIAQGEEAIKLLINRSNDEKERINDKHNKKLLSDLEKFGEQRAQIILSQNDDLIRASEMDEIRRIDESNVIYERERSEAASTLKGRALRLRLKEIESNRELREAQARKAALTQRRSANEATIARLSIAGVGGILPPTEEQRKKLIEENTKIAKEITEIETNEARKAADFKITESERVIQQKQRERDALIDLAQSTSDGIFRLEQLNIQAETDARIRAINKVEETRLKAVQGNAVLEERIRKESEEKRRAVEIEAVERNAEIAKSQAAINTALAVTRIWADTVDPTGGILKGILTATALTTLGFEIATINKNAQMQIAALRGEEGLVIPNRDGNFRAGQNIIGKRHSEGGELAIINGRLVEAEAGERFDYDENGNAYVINRNSTKQFKGVLDAIANRDFTGKGALLSDINYLGGGKKLMRNGGMIPIKTVIPNSGVNVNAVTTMNDATMMMFARTVANETARAVYAAQKDGAKDARNETRRESLAQRNAII